MSALGETLRAALPEGVHLRDWSDRHIVNIIGEGRDLTPDDVTALRAALTAAGCVEVRSWIATEGASWLSNGVASVSFEILPPVPSRVAARDEPCADPTNCDIHR